MELDEREAELQEWLAGRPQVIKDLAARIKPWLWYMLETDEAAELSRYRLYSYSENGTVQLVRYAVATCDPMWRVFGISPEDMIEANSPEEEKATWTPELLSHALQLHDQQMVNVNLAALGK